MLVNNVLVVGGGIAGMSSAIRLLEEGVRVTIVDKDPNWSVYGAGITCSPLTFRALCDLGFGDELVEKGAPHNEVIMHDLAGNPTNSIPLPRIMGENIDAAGGIMRPALHEIMSHRVKSLGATVRLGLTVKSISEDADGVDIAFSDDTSGRYDIVIGADGLFSTMRDMVLDGAPKPEFTGQACWRIMFELPKDWEGKGVMFISPTLKVGFTPCAPGEMYLYMLEHVPDNPWREPEQLPVLLHELLSEAGGRLAELRDQVRADTPINYRPLESILIDGDWYNKRAILIGDTVHATTPHLAAGAGMAVEDSLVLVQELKRCTTVNEAFEAFMDRRLERGRMVVQDSREIGRLEMAGAPMSEQGALMQNAMAATAAPY